MKKKRQLQICFVTILLLILGILLGIGIIRGAFRRALAERDEQLFHLADAIDNALTHELTDIKTDPLAVMNGPYYPEDEKYYLQTGDTSRLAEAFSFMAKERRRNVSAVLIEHKGELKPIVTEKELTGKSQSGDKETFTQTQSVYKILYKAAQQDLCIVADEDARCYIGISVDTPLPSMLRYYFLINLEDFYSKIVPYSLRTDNWVVLFHAPSGLAIQNQDNQLTYKIRSKEEYEAREDGYTWIMHYEENEVPGVVTYRYVSDQGKVVPSRLVTLPSCNTQNGLFAIGIARESAEFYTYQRKVQCGLAAVLLIMLTASGSLIYFYFRQYFMNEKMARDMEYMEREKVLNHKLTLAQMKNSVSQMQPHFMYNALSSIRELIYENPQYAEDMLYDFTVYLRSCIRAMGSQDMIPFEEEVRNIEAYANIEKMRIGEQLEIIYDIQDSDFQITPLVIQPLVENSIRHGIAKRRGKWGTVKVSSYLGTQASSHDSKNTGLCHIIKVEDNGLGFDYDQIIDEIGRGERDSTGLTNVVYRLKYIMHAKVEIHTKPGEGCQITIEIPLERKL